MMLYTSLTFLFHMSVCIQHLDLFFGGLLRQVSLCRLCYVTTGHHVAKRSSNEMSGF